MFRGLPPRTSGVISMWRSSSSAIVVPSTIGIRHTRAASLCYTRGDGRSAQAGGSMASFSGIIPPTVTLFNDDLSIDWDGTLRHMDWLIAAGVHGLFILGTTGEFTQFTVTERKEYAQKAVEHVKGRVPVIIGTGSV